MALQVNPLALFIGKIFLLLPLAYWGWYSFAEQSSYLVVFITEPLLQFWFPGLIAGIEQSGYLLEVVANVTVPMQEVPRVLSAELPVPVNPLIYSYGLPLALALILASPITSVKTVSSIIFSLLLFLVIQIWGISFETLKVLFIQTPPELLANHNVGAMQTDIIALGYQLGALILPAVTPIIIWLVFFQGFIVQLTSSVAIKTYK